MTLLASKSLTSQQELKFKLSQQQFSDNSTSWLLLLREGTLLNHELGCNTSAWNTIRSGQWWLPRQCSACGQTWCQQVLSSAMSAVKMPWFTHDNSKIRLQVDPKISTGFVPNNADTEMVRGCHWHAIQHWRDSTQLCTSSCSGWHKSFNCELIHNQLLGN